VNVPLLGYLRGAAHRTQQGLKHRLRQVSDLASRIGFEIQLSYLQRIRKAPIKLEIRVDRSDIGLFAELNLVVYLIIYARSVGAAPNISTDSELYFDPETGQRDWIGQLFDTQWREVKLPGQRTIRRTITTAQQLPRWADRVGQVDLPTANAIALSHLRPKPHLLETVERFIADHLSGSYLAIHWRGTDKVKEAPSVTLTEVIDKVSAVLQHMHRPPAHIFLASDDQRLIADLRAGFATALPNVSVVTRSDVIRSLDGQPVHLRSAVTPLERRRMGEEALVDCLLLSRASALVRTASFLSGWASVFEPAVPVYLLNKPYEHCIWFPDREVIHISERCHRALSQSAGATSP
jgi:hypothetical protein